MSFLMCQILCLELSASESKTQVDEAYQYLLAIGDTNDIDVVVTRKYTDNVLPICSDVNEEIIFRSFSCYVLAGLHGKLADKLRMKGIEDGKQMFLFIKSAISLNPSHVPSVLYYGDALIGVYNEGPIGRRTAARLLGINLNQEFMNAKLIFEKLALQNHELYKKIVDAIN